MKNLSAGSRKHRAKRADQNELFKRALNLLSDAVLLLDRKQKIIFTNSKAATLFGIPRQAILGKPLERILTIEDPSSGRRLEKPPSVANGPVVLLGTAGERLFHVTAIDIHRTAGFRQLKSRALVGLFIRPSDITVEATNVYQNIIGQLTMRIAHDFNNQLTSMLGNAELVQEALEIINSQEDNNPETPAGHAIPINRDVIRKCLEMATGIRKLQDYAQQQTTARRDVDLNATVSQTLPVAQRVLGSRLTIEFVPTENIPIVAGDQTLLHQLLFTIFDNCKERALNAKGTVTVKTSRETLDEHFASTHPGARAGEHLKLLITDHGQLLPPDSLPTPAQLFTSNKPAAALRLATTYSLVKQMGAYIHIDSDELAGTRFQVYFPLNEETEKPQPFAVTKTRGHQARRARRAAQKPRLILIAEDSPDIQRTIVRNLSNAGYETDVAGTGVDALARFEALNSNGHRLSLVIADLGLPGMDGRTLCKKIKSKNPRMPVLLTSGHSIPLDETRTRTTDGLPFISKPFDTATLLKRIIGLLTAA